MDGKVIDEGLPLETPFQVVSEKKEASVVGLHTFEILDIDWTRYFPLSLGQEGLEADIVDPDLGLQFIREFYPKICGLQNRQFYSEEMSERKINYYRRCGDFFMFKSKKTPIGIYVGSTTDWNSYYLRTSAVFPEFRGNGLYQKLLSHLIEVLTQAGVHRADGDVPPSNLPHVHTLNKLKFQITGFTVSERWGAMTRFTRFLQEKNEEVFQRQFCISDFQELPGKTGPMEV